MANCVLNRHEVRQHQLLFFPMLRAPPQAAIDILIRNNGLLRSLRSEDLAAVKPRLDHRTLPAGAELYGPGDDLHRLYFPCSQTLITISIPMGPGEEIASLLVGREGAAGALGGQKYSPSFSRMYTEAGGDVLSLPAEDLEALRQNSPSLDDLFARYADCLVAQIFQTAACNAAHSVEQRVAKLVSAAVDRTNSQSVAMTQEQLSRWLSVGRPYVSRVLRDLRQRDLLTVRRGHLVVTDLARLRERACRCDEAVKAHFARVLPGAVP